MKEFNGMKLRRLIVSNVLLAMMVGLLAGCEHVEAAGVEPTQTSMPEPTSDEPAVFLDLTPEIAISPNQGMTGTWVNVTGRGFLPGEVVSLQIGNEDAVHEIGQTVADNSGQVAIMFSVPATWPTGQRITAPELAVKLVGMSTGGEAMAMFDHTLPPTSTPVLTDILPAESDPDSTAIAPTPTLPSSPTPRPTAAPMPDLNPAISLSPSTPVGGATVEVTGTDYPADAPVSIRLALPGGNGMQVAEGRSTPEGTFRLSFVMPTQWVDGTTIPAGKLEVRASSSAGGWYSWVTFEYKGH